MDSRTRATSFMAPKANRPLNLANLARRVIVPTLREAGVQCWSGFHGFRPGLATNLYELGVEEPTIQAILRHADVATTRRHCFKKNVVSKASLTAMNRLEKDIHETPKARPWQFKSGYERGCVGKPQNERSALKITVVSVAQLVEHRSVAPRVAGSNPVAHPNYLLRLRIINRSISA